MSRYDLICVTVPKDRVEHANLSVVQAEDPRNAQHIFDEVKKQGLKVHVYNNYLNMDETHIFERGIWRV